MCAVGSAMYCSYRHGGRGGRVVQSHAVQSLPEKDKVSDVLGKQILRSGTSIGANYRSALRGRSDKDFLSRISIAEEEAY